MPELSFAPVGALDEKIQGSFGAEQAVLGSVLLDSGLIAVILERLSPAHFHLGLHSDIFSAIQQMFISAKPVDIVTLIEETLKNNVFDSREEAQIYMAALSEAVPSLSGIDAYIKIIEEKYMTRQLIYAAKEIYDLANSGAEESEMLLDFAETKIYNIRSEREIRGLQIIKPIVIEKIKQLSELAANPDKNAVTGLSTGFLELDRYVFGLNKSDLILVAGRPGMGKTTFALNIALNTAKRYRDKKIAIFSLEMSREQLVGRIISAEAKVTPEQMKTGNIGRVDWKNISESAELLTQLEVYIDDTASISIGEMKAKLRRMKNLGLVVIDYLQLMSTGRRDGNRVSEISEITRNLKIMAKELDIPVILASQLSRGPESRTDKRPMLSDLRESGSIEQDADIVAFLYRNSYYNKEDEHPNSCECIIAKNRHGETATIGLNFEGHFSRFTTAEYRHVSEY